MMQRNPQSPYPRRPPAHLSVSLRHESPSTTPNRAGAVKLSSHRPAGGVGRVPAAVSPIRNSPDGSHDLGGTSKRGTWFDRANKHPAVNLDENFLDNEPPYFLPRHDSSHDSKAASDSGSPRKSDHCRYGISNAGIPLSATKGSSADDFRSVIDDLTIENKKLKEKLRRYEGLYSAHLEKDKLFEVKVHSLPAKKKRELEETLRSFAASLDGFTDSDTKPPRGTRKHNVTPVSKNASLSSSMSRPTDSAYASMSTSGPGSFSKLKELGEDKTVLNPHSKDQNVQSFLHNMPEGLMPRHSTVMTERQKQNIVVRRLEQLFTGKAGSLFGEHSQPLQQQEVSESAALADRAASTVNHPAEGVREAHILPFEMEVDSRKPLMQFTSSNLERHDSRGSSNNSSPEISSPEQRPTRPLDLDPDRAQIPSDNVDYLRHLGLSTANIQRWSSSDVEPDADGWIYLNLLINMAQLHIINVTPDFVRSAVADVSDKFQLSRDGRKIRWRGGTEGTRLSSDSGNCSARDRSPLDSDCQEEDSRRKRRKMDSGKFASVPVESTDRVSSQTLRSNPLYYKPLFHHRDSSSEDATSLSESEACFGFGENSKGGRTSRTPHLRSRGSYSMSAGSGRRHDNGPIVFYSGAQFCVDLSGDRKSISTPLYSGTSGRDGHSKEVLGKPVMRSTLMRTPSGSFLPYRPFKDYSKGTDLFQTAETRPRTPEMMSEESTDLNFSLEWSQRAAPVKPLINFEASGLGGTRPADHFAVQVETRRTIFKEHTRPKLSKFSAPGPSSRKFVHSISRSALEFFKHPSNSDDLSAALASLYARSPSPPAEVESKLPIKTEIVAARFARLHPSALPAALGFYTTNSSDESSSAFSRSSSYSGISHLRRAPRSHITHSAHASSLVIQDTTERGQDSENTEEDDDDDDDDESIDMLASARQADPQTIAAREAEFELQASRRMMEELPAGSSAATIDGGSGASCASSEISDSDSEDMDFA